MKILVACEYTGITVKEFEKLGHRVSSCDVLPATGDDWNHLQCDVRDILEEGWDMIIAHPPPGDVALINAIVNAPVEKIVIENPPRFLPKGLRQIFKPFPGMRCSAVWLKGLVPLIERAMERGAVYHYKRDNSIETDSWLAKTMAQVWG